MAEHQTIKRPKNTVRFRELLRIAWAHMSRKKARTAVTVGGMAIGIGAIVFLVSIGYGLQELVVGRVARLEELRQVQVATQQGSQLKINDETLANLRQLPEVEQVLPLVSVVGRVNYQNSTSDVAAFGVTTDYLRTSAIQPSEGELFDNNALTVSPADEEQEEGLVDDDGSAQGEANEDGLVLGVSDEQGDTDSGKVTFSIQPEEWISVRDEPSVGASRLGYTRRLPGGEQTGELVEGGTYQALEGEEVLSDWILAQVPLWSRETCGEDEDCEVRYVELRDGEEQVRAEGYFGTNLVAVGLQPKVAAVEGGEVHPRVLGISAEEGEETVASGDRQGRVLAGTLELVELQDGDGQDAEPEVEQVSVSTTTPHQTVVNRPFLEVLGIPVEEAVGKEFSLSYVVVSNLLEDATRKLESAPLTYTIVGVVPENESPAIYVPFVDVRSLGVASFSQLKVIASSQNVVSDVRSRIEAMGYTTNSVLDTVEQINSFFNTARIILGVVGSVALVIAALGMFNTLTVSLLERTHEVGLMKAIGMKSREVKKLFLVESLAMGFLGGVLGLFLGYLAGLMASLVLSSLALTRGGEAITVSAIPLFLVLGVMTLALVVGVVTGFYPARRATRISALNALRYE